MDGKGQQQLFFEVFGARTKKRSAPHAPEQPEQELKAIHVVEASEAAPSNVLQLQPRSHVFTVRELIGSVRRHIEGGFAGTISVEGEVSNCRSAGSGHVYLTLKDGEAQLPVILFRQRALLLRFRLRDGLAVRVRGRLSLYETRGQLQLVAEWVEEQGTGALQRAYEELRTRLVAEGLFSREKRALPAFPRCIGVVTSVSGAVIQDIVNVVRRRHARLNLLIYPALTQGTGCAKSVSDGIKWFNRYPERVEVIVIARGGGSLEDLAGFNDETLARVIAGSGLPVVSAVGHETDTTIADFVADLRAPTPSAAAELITAAQEQIEERIAGLSRRVERAGTYQIMLMRQRIGRLAADQVLRRVRDGVGRRAQRTDECEMRLLPGVERGVRGRAARLAQLEVRLGRCDPQARLVAAQHRLAASVGNLQTIAGSFVAYRRARLERWEVSIRTRELLAFVVRTRMRMARSAERLERRGESIIANRQVSVFGVSKRLDDLSPLAVLQRGYAIAYTSDGRVLRDARDTAASEQVRIRLGVGSLRAAVLERELP